MHIRSVLRMQAQGRTATGAAFLDYVATADDHEYPEIIPVRWYDVIDLGVLNVASHTSCVLAQLGQASRHNLLHYSRTAAALGMNPYPMERRAAVIERGFRAESGEWASEEYQELTVAWRLLIAERRRHDLHLAS